MWGAIEIEARGLGADDAWLENGWKFPQFSVFANKGRCLIFGFVGVQVCTDNVACIAYWPVREN